MNKHQVSVAAESLTATLFAWAGFDVSVQYGANQPEYDLVVVRGDNLIKVSVKGSKDGKWGLTQSYKNKTTSYHEAADIWVSKHGNKTVLSLVQFEDVNLESGELPRVYLATPYEIGEYLKHSKNGTGDTRVKEEHFWTSGMAVGTTDKIPDEWKFSRNRIEELINLISNG